MRVQLDKDVAAEAVQWAARSLPLRPSLPILAGLLIQAETDSVTLSSFDYETSARITVAAQVEEPGTALVSGRLLAEIIRSLPGKPISLSSDDQALELVCGSARFDLQLLPAADYPDLPRMPQTSGSIKSDELAKAVNQVVVAAGRDELLPVFTGVRLEFEDEQVSLLATDRYRMALKELTWRPTSPNLSAAALVPARVLSEIAKSLVSGDQVTLSLATAGSGEGLIGFEGEGVNGHRQITTRLLDGEFPKVRHLMNIANELSVRANVAELLSAVKRVALVAERNTSLSMLIGDDGVTLEAASGDQARASETVTAVVENHAGGDLPLDQAGFNPHYLSDVLSVLDAPYVHLSFSGPGKPCLVTALEDIDGDPLLNYRHVIMLMRLPH
ncbi:MAG: DNA polymerase III subunit beta [Propionibacteriaceae bacterium]|jgi:DNA polymerase-3 subunit beta|nr:DNA polymerase III subunit beta [Propionibacteriaceae bacterium]